MSSTRKWLRRTRLNGQSRKRQRQNRERQQLRAELPQVCTASHAPEPCYGGLTMHEILPRARGGSITDRTNIAMVCAHHNTWLSQSVEGQRWGHENGLLKHSWEGDE